MNKTSVYLDDDDVARLRRLQEATGKSQSELIRDGIRALDGDEAEPRPRMRSVGSGDWTIDGERRWDADDLARRRGLG